MLTPVFKLSLHPESVDRMFKTVRSPMQEGRIEHWLGMGRLVEDHDSAES